MLLQRRLSARVARGWHRAKAEECVTASDTYTGVPKKATHFVTVGGGHAHATAAEGERREKEVEVQVEVVEQTNIEHRSTRSRVSEFERTCTNFKFHDCTPTALHLQQLSKTASYKIAMATEGPTCNNHWLPSLGDPNEPHDR